MRGWASPLAAVVLALVPVPATAQDQGLRLVGVEQLSMPGRARIRAEVLDPAIDAALGTSPSDLSVKLDDGQASIESVSRAGALGLRTHTVVAVDHSGSFKRWGHAEPAWEFVAAVGAALAPDDTVTLELFSETVTRYPVRSAADDLAIDTAEARGADWGVITRLHNALIQAVDEAALENPGGFNRIYVLTDGDEESETWTWRDVAKVAAAKGVQIHVVIYPPDMKRLSKTELSRLPTRLDDLRALAAATGGAAVEFAASAPADTLAVPALWEARGRDALVVEASLCGLTRASADNVARLDYSPGGGPRTAWTDGFPFAEWGSPELFAPCPGDAVAEAPTPAAPPPAPRSVTPWWVWAIVAALAVLLVLALLLGRRREATEVVVTRAEPPVPLPAPVPAPDPAPVAVPAPPRPARLADSPLPWDLPRTFLEVVGGGQWLKDPRYALFKRELTLGADASRNVDLLVEHPGVSGQHCTVQLFPRGDVWVRDDGSSNGTFVDGVKVPSGGKLKVDLGGEIRLGSEIRFRLARPEPPGAVPSRDSAGGVGEPTEPPGPATSGAVPPRRTPKKTRIVE